MRKIKGMLKADGSVDISYTYTISHDQLASRKTALQRQAEGMANDIEVITTRRNEILEEIAAIDNILNNKV